MEEGQQRGGNASYLEGGRSPQRQRTMEASRSSGC